MISAKAFPRAWRLAAALLPAALRGSPRHPRRGAAPGPLHVPRPADAQVPCITWRGVCLCPAPRLLCTLTRLWVIAEPSAAQTLGVALLNKE